MRFLVLSDLHTELAEFRPSLGLDYDAVILAGDIHAGDEAPRWASSATIFGRDKPVVVVPGNHEYYGGTMQVRRRQLQEAAAPTPNITVLDPGELLLDDGRMRVLGCTLWTDFRAPVTEPGGPKSHAPYAIEDAWRHMNDYRGSIGFQAPGSKLRSLEPADTLAINHVERAWLLAKLQEPFVGTTIVVTHHAPSLGSVAAERADNWLTPAYVNDLPDAFFEVPALWIHGHTHTSFDYMRGNTRVVCNPRGYPMSRGGYQNQDFDPGLVIEVDPIHPTGPNR